MIITKPKLVKIARIEHEPIEVVCNKCGQSIRYDTMGGLTAHYSGGYESKIGDCISFSFDLCDNCIIELKKTFKHEVTYYRNDFNDEEVIFEKGSAKFIVTDLNKETKENIKDNGYLYWSEDGNELLISDYEDGFWASELSIIGGLYFGDKHLWFYLKEVGEEDSIEKAREQVERLAKEDGFTIKEK